MICAYWLLNGLCKYMLSSLEVFHIIIIKQILEEKKSEDVKDCRVGFSLAKIVIMWKRQRSEARQKCVNKFFLKAFSVLAFCQQERGVGEGE